MAKSNMPIVGIAIVILVAVTLGVITGYIPTGQQVVPGRVAPSGAVSPTGVVCESSATPDWTPFAHDADNPATALSESNNIRRKVGSTAWDTFTQGTAEANLEKHTQYEVVYGISTTDWTDNAYGPHKFIQIGCEDTTEDMPLYDDSIETALVAAFYDADNNAAGEVFAAGAVQTVELRWEAASEDYCGNPYIMSDPTMSDNGKHSRKYPNMLCFPLNSTAWEKPQKVSYEIEGGLPGALDASGYSIPLSGELDSVSIPTIQAGSATGVTYCYEAPVLGDSTVKFHLKLEADGSVAPTVDETASFYCGNYYIDDDGNVAWGVETDLGSFVGVDAADTTTLDFT